MGRDTGPVCRQCRREGAKLFLKGARCYTKKCSFERRPTPPGMHAVRRRKVGDYGLQLREKQKMRRVYRLGETQFRRLFEEAERGTDVTGDLVPDRDVDGDGTINGWDLDSDGDGFADVDEGTADDDRDGLPDYLDYQGGLVGGGCGRGWAWIFAPGLLGLRRKR